MDHCRIGSLERAFYAKEIEEADHCRIGSLESADFSELLQCLDHCRIGSLEILGQCFFVLDA